MLMHDHEAWRVERRSDGAVVVRVPSCTTVGEAVPEAVFAFRNGDPQYSYWEQRLLDQEHAG
jgi:hypothetical protein